MELLCRYHHACYKRHLICRPRDLRSPPRLLAPAKAAKNGCRCRCRYRFPCRGHSLVGCCGRLNGRLEVRHWGQSLAGHAVLAVHARAVDEALHELHLRASVAHSVLASAHRCMLVSVPCGQGHEGRLLGLMPRTSSGCRQRWAAAGTQRPQGLRYRERRRQEKDHFGGSSPVFARVVDSMSPTYHPPPHQGETWKEGSPGWREFAMRF